MSVELFRMNCPNCGRETMSGSVYECQFCGKLLCRQGGCAIGDDSLCPHCGKHAGYGDNCFDEFEVRSRHGFTEVGRGGKREDTEPLPPDDRRAATLVVVYHPGYIPGNSDPVPHDIVSFLEGDSSTCNQLSSQYARTEQDYWEVARFDGIEEAMEYVKKQGLRIL